MANSTPLVPAKPPPSLNIPISESTVAVSIIDTTSSIIIPMGLMTTPIVGNFETANLPVFSFLITHPSGRKLLFDLGVRKDYHLTLPKNRDRLQKLGLEVKIEKDVSEILGEHGVDVKQIEAIIWSHYHFDHTGDPSTFPPETALIVGPGVVKKFPVAWPTDDDAPLDEGAWAGRERKEISFSDTSLKIGRFRAFDYFGDGSFYLLDTPGHLLGHMCGLARTTEDTFILMGGDAGHHAGEWRPTEYMPLPKNIDLDSVHPRSWPCPCPGDLVQKHIHPEKSATKPFLALADGFNEDVEVARWTLDGVTEFDCDEHVFTIIAHDGSLLSAVDFFPKPITEWHEKGWGTASRWRFLADFSQGLDGSHAAGAP